MDARANDVGNVAAEQIMNMVAPTDARVNVTWAGNNGDLPDTVHYDSPDADVKQWITEAIRTGHVPGIPADATVNLTDFVVDRFPANEAVPYNRIMIRPKTAFGGSFILAGALPKECPFWERHITLGRVKDGKVHYAQCKGEKETAMSTMRKDMEEGAVFFLAWTGKWRTDLFEVTEKDIEAFNLLRYARTA